MKIIEHLFKQKSIKLEVDYISDPTFEREVAQVMLNIFKNDQDTFKEYYIKDPLIKTTCKIEPGYAIIPVDGNSIMTEVIDILFLPYIFANMQKWGTALSLYMSKTIIEEHSKGSITIKNIFDAVSPLKDTNGPS